MEELKTTYGADVAKIIESLYYGEIRPCEECGVLSEKIKDNPHDPHVQKEYNYTGFPQNRINPAVRQIGKNYCAEQKNRVPGAHDHIFSHADFPPIT